MQDSTSDRSGSERKGKIFLALFGSIFLIIGLVALKPILITPLQKINAAKSWETTPAVIVSSEVKTHDNSDGDTYSAYITYRYKHNGTNYSGDQYTFMGGSSSGYASKAEKVRNHPPGREINIFVNPQNPSESVINRDPSLELLFGLIPLIFVLVGTGIIIGAFRKAKFRELDPKQAGQHVIRLKGKSPIGKLIGITLFALIWNSVVVFLFIAGAPLLFKVLFGLAGLAVIAGVVHAFLACFNPRPFVEITPGNIRPGSKTALRWNLSGRVERIDALTISLRCLHVTTETRRSGSKTTTTVEKRPIFTNELFTSKDQRTIALGVLEFQIPEEQPASRRSNTDGIEWELIFHGDIPKWPDIKDELKFLVYPN